MHPCHQGALRSSITLLPYQQVLRSHQGLYLKHINQSLQDRHQAPINPFPLEAPRALFIHLAFQQALLSH
jgi:hypothetical protein